MWVCEAAERSGCQPARDPFVEGPVASGSGRADPGVGICLGGSLVSYPVYLLDLQAAFPGGLGCVPCICVMV